MQPPCHDYPQEHKIHAGKHFGRTGFVIACLTERLSASKQCGLGICACLAAQERHPGFRYINSIAYTNHSQVPERSQRAAHHTLQRRLEGRGASVVI